MRLLETTLIVAIALVSFEAHAQTHQAQDFDKDGVPDAEDDCPTDPGVKENAGCRAAPAPPPAPVRAPPKVENVAVKGDTIELPRPVEFEVGSARLAASAEPLIDALALTLANLAPGKVVLVRGHTDNRGARAANLLLSRRRAEAVVKALVAQGIAAEKLASEGLGPDEPVASNSDESGRSKNRRVEFKLIDAGERPKKK